MQTHFQLQLINFLEEGIFDIMIGSSQVASINIKQDVDPQELVLLVSFFALSIFHLKILKEVSTKDT